MPPLIFSPLTYTIVFCVTGLLLWIIFLTNSRPDQGAQAPAISEAEQAQKQASEIAQAKYQKDLADARRAEAQTNAAKSSAELSERGPKPKPSEWDGITPEANAWLRENLNDYRSMELVRCYSVVPYGKDAWLQRVDLRATNGFGAKVLQTWGFVIRDGQVIDAEHL